MIGYGTNGPTGAGGGTRLEFNQSIPTTSVFPNPAGSGEITSMSDSLGKFLFFASGCEVYDSTLTLMENGDSLNSPGENFDYSCSASYNYAIKRSIMALPTPSSTTKYSLFHLRMDGNILSSPDTYQHPRSFLQTDIDMSKNGGLGTVTQKNQLISKDTFAETLTATRHANGRDWWIPVMKRPSNKIYVFRFSPEGLSEPKISYFPFTLEVIPGNEDYWIYTVNVFSPDGSHYACNDSENGLIISNFDRCSGELSGTIKFFPVPNPEFYGGGVAFSPNSRFLYVTTDQKILQFDLYASDIEGSKVLLDTADIIVGTLPNSFYQMLLGPDDKIYVSSAGGKKVLSVINNPNEKGVACQFVEAGFPLPTASNWCLPNIPYYRLHELPGSPCDTLTVSVKNPIKPKGFSLHPNPATDQFQILFAQPTAAPAQLTITDISGKSLQSLPISIGSKNLLVSTENLPSGCYFVQILPDIGRPEVRKLFIAR